MTVAAPQLTRCPACSGGLEPVGVLQGVRCVDCSWEGSGFATGTPSLTAASLKVGDEFEMPEVGHGFTYKLLRPDWAESLDGTVKTTITGIEHVVITRRRLKFRVEWYEGDPQNVGLIYVGSLVKIAELFWNGGEWLFIPCDKDGSVMTESGVAHDALRHIDVDPGRRMHLNAIAEENNIGRVDRNEAVQQALEAALVTRRREFRDETRDLAVMGAKLFARAWYPKWRDL